MSRIDRLRAYMRDVLDPAITQLLFFEHTNDEGKEMVGVIFCDLDPGSDRLDLHCERCRDEIMPFVIHGPDDELADYIMVSVGPKKYARIEAGWRESNGLDLRRVRFV